MASSSDNISMAVFCDFENVALGVRDANYEKFDIKPVLERLLLKGSIVVKKAYCDWDRYKGFKSTMHEANFELIEIPHVRQSGKNSADIRLVVDALDLCYTKSHVNTFVIISGDSDFSPLVSKLRENAKQVIGVGVKQSTSDLLVANCDEFIFYDDLVREVSRVAAKRDARKAAPQNNKRPSDDRRKEELEARKTQALDMVAETFDALVAERGDTGKIWASLLKDTLKRRRPEFSEVYYGFRTFGNLLEEAQLRGMFEFGRDEKSGTYVFRSSGAGAAQQGEGVAVAEPVPEGVPAEEAAAPGEAKDDTKGKGRTRGGRGRKSARAETPFVAVTPDEAAQAVLAEEPTPADVAEAWPEPIAAAQEAAGAAEPVPEVEEAAPAAKKERRRAPRKAAARKGAPVEAAAEPAQVDAVPAPLAPVAEIAAPVAALAAESDEEDEDVLPDDVNGNVAPSEDGAKRSAPNRAATARPARKPAARSRRPAKPKAAPGNS
ncbi:NYN domain-containing protein [Massilia jejuensis]|uniref:NYN domain-containing protein n=1 Tax=Massilia jejuensis TaxID=648894 RepID=A0ABW0PMM0_9BURK